MKKKKFLLGVLLATAFLGVTSCDGKDPDADKTQDNGGSQSGDQETEKYTVTFNTNGGSAVASQEVDEGGKATRPSNPTKTADSQYTYTFENWYKDSACTQLFDFNTAITANTTIFAKWTSTPVQVTKYTVTFELNGGIGVGITSQEVNAGGKATRPTVDPIKMADTQYTYSFAGWYKDSALTQEFNFNTETINAATTIYAKYTATAIPTTTYTVTFNTNGGSTVTAQTVTAGGKATRPTTDPTKEADAQNTYSFAGWYKDAGLSQEFDFNTEIINSATTIYAKWTATPIQGDETVYEEFEVDSTNVKKLYEVGDTLDLTGLVVTAYDSDFNDIALTAGQYTVTLKDSTNTEVATNSALEGGAYTVYIGVKTVNNDPAKQFTINVQASQYRFSIPLSADDYNNSRGADKVSTGEITLSAETTLYNGKALTIVANTGVKLQVTDSNSNPVEKDYEGETYTSRLQVNTGQKKMVVTPKTDGTLVILFATDATRKICCEGSDGSSAESYAPTADDKSDMHAFTISVKKNVSYTLTSSTGGSNIYAITFNGTDDASNRVEVDELYLNKTQTEFDNDSNKFNADAPNTLEVVAEDNYGIQAVIAAANYTVVVKNAADETVTGEITTAGEYTVYVTYKGVTESYTIVVADAFAQVTAIQIDTTNVTTTFYEGGAAFNTDGIVVTATKGAVTLTLSADDYTVDVNNFTTSGTYTVTITSVENTSVSNTYTVTYNTIDAVVLNAPDTLNVKTGSTEYNTHATAEGTYTDESKVSLTKDITYKLYSDLACTTEVDATTAFATANVTVYAKVTCRDVSKVTTITVKDFTSNSYDFEATAVTTEDIAAGTTIIDKSDVTVKNVGIKANVVADKSTATANDDSGKTFTKALVTTGGMSDTKYYEITTTSNAIVTIYFTSTDGKFGTTDQSKGGELVVDDVQVTTVTGNKDNKIAYAYTFETSANTPVKIRVSSNRMALFGIVVES